jgi:predicted GIY-YIG superfamily endonuclease
MVKEREEEISDLLKENEEMKRLIAVHRKDGDEHKIHQDEFVQLRTELDTAAAALEESQDRNVLLEEEVEAGLPRATTWIQRLRDDSEAWQRKATAAEQTMAIVEASAQSSAKQAISAEAALQDAERKFKKQLQEQERRHTENLLDQKERAAKQLMAEAEKNS